MSRRGRPASPVAAPPAVPDAPARAGLAGPVAAALAAIVVLGVVLRVAGMRQGLPDFVEEAVPFRWALAMWARPDGRIDWNPHHFIYPSLTVYLQLALQLLHATLGRLAGRFAGPADYHLAFQLDPTPMVLLARALGIAADAGSVVLVGRLGERMRPGAGLVAAALVACSPVMIATSRAIYTDPVLLVLALAALERMQVYRAERGRARLVVVSALVGLAIGAKYPAAVLLLPLAWTLVRAHGRDAWRAGLMALPVVAATFLVTTPFAVLDAARFARDVSFDRVLVAEGVLGATGGASGWHTLAALARDLGPVATALAPAGLALALWRDRSRPGVAAVALAGAGFLLPLVVSPLRFERYLLGVIPAAALCVGLAASALATRFAGRARRAAAAALALAIALPALAAALPLAREAAASTQRQALDWCEAHLGRDDLILTETYGPPLLTRQGASVAAASALFAHASPHLRARALARPWFSAVRIPALVAGTCVVGLRAPDGTASDVTVFAHAADFNRVLYDPRLLAGVDVVITSSAIQSRFLADPVRYAVPCAFYRLLDSVGTVAARFETRPGVSGPAIVIHRLERARIQPPDTLSRWWWTERIPDDYRARANAVLAPGRSAPMRATGERGEPAPWVLGLRPFYRSQLEFFTQDLAYNLVELGRPEPARRLMDAALAIDPGSQWSCLLFVEAGRALGDWTGVRSAVERTAAANRGGALDSALVSEYAEALSRTGAPARARALRDSLASAPAR